MLFLDHNAVKWYRYDISKLSEHQEPCNRPVFCQLYVHGLLALVNYLHHITIAYRAESGCLVNLGLLLREDNNTFRLPVNAASLSTPALVALPRPSCISSR